MSSVLEVLLARVVPDRAPSTACCRPFLRLTIAISVTKQDLGRQSRTGLPTGMSKVRIRASRRSAPKTTCSASACSCWSSSRAQHQSSWVSSRSQSDPSSPSSLKFLIWNREPAACLFRRELSGILVWMDFCRRGFRTAQSRGLDSSSD